MNIIPIGIWGGFPKANEATSSFLIEHDGFHCLIDCGSGVLSSLQNFVSLDQLDAVVISHYHADHIADIGSLQFSRLIDFHLGKSTPILPIYGHTKDPENYAKLSFEGRTVAHEISEDKSIQIGPFTVSFCETIHPVYCLAMKFTLGEKSVVLTADTAWCEELIAFAHNTDLLISEANLYEMHKGKAPGHMAGSEAGLLAQKAEVKQLLLTHLPQYGDVQDILDATKLEYTGPAELAVVGKTYSLS
ncbi:MBL fold metallo-hydrolase [Sporosarcina sp. CAU 1771]